MRPVVWPFLKSGKKALVVVFALDMVTETILGPVKSVFIIVTVVFRGGEFTALVGCMLSFLQPCTVSDYFLKSFVVEPLNPFYYSLVLVADFFRRFMDCHHPACFKVFDDLFSS